VINSACRVRIRPGDHRGALQRERRRRVGGGASEVNSHGSPETAMLVIVRRHDHVHVATAGVVFVLAPGGENAIQEVAVFGVAGIDVANVVQPVPSIGCLRPG